MRRFIPFRLAAALALLLAAAAAPAQVRHCVSADGTDLYTDKRCDALGAVPAPPRAEVSPGLSARRAACARTLRDLAFELQSAIDSRDVNRLAASYDWAGLSTRSGYAVLDRLSTIAQRPLLDIVPVHAPSGTDDPFLPEVPQRAPLALRLEQVLRDSATPAPSILVLRRQLGCWWVRF